jgi:hypothetical protein
MLTSRVEHFMKTARVFCVSVVLLALSAQSAFARLTVSFSVNSAAWQATNIVVVETTPIPGTFGVLESWKGDLAVGSQVVLPGLIPPPNAVPISGYPKKWIPGEGTSIVEQIPKQPVGSRLVLFLRRKEQVKGERTSAEWSGWTPWDDPDSMRISAVWIEDDTAYIFRQQWDTSEPLTLAVLPQEGKFTPGQSEKDLKAGVAKVLQLQKDMAAAVAGTAGRERALRLKPYVHSENFSARRTALDELGKAGPSAVGAIGEMFDDPAFAEEEQELIRAMVQAGGKTAGDELNRRLEGELSFWRSAGPSLTAGWWNNYEPVRVSPLQAQYNRTYLLIGELGEIEYPGALNTVNQLRDLWRTLPAVDQRHSDRNRISEECDKLIELLQTK